MQQALDTIILEENDWWPLYREGINFLNNLVEMKFNFLNTTNFNIHNKKVFAEFKFLKLNTFEHK